MLLIDLARTSAAVASDSSRLAKIGHLAEALGGAGPAEAALAVAYLSGELPQRQIGVGWRGLQSLPDPAAEATLTLSAVDDQLSKIKECAGAGSQAAKRQLVDRLFGAATPDEQQFLVRLLTGELRQGALDGVMADAIAKASQTPATEVRRALMLRGSLPAVGSVALRDGAAGLRELRLEVGRALQPMLASSADTVATAMEKVGEAGVEWKLDGVRVQAHKSGNEVAVFTRTLDDITARVPELVEAVLALPVREAVLDGEVILLRPDGRPFPFEDTASRVGSKLDVGRLRERYPLSVYFFDLLHQNGSDLLDLTGQERSAALAEVVPTALLTPRLVTASAEDAEAFFADTVSRGHEGVLIKSLASPYAAGRRGAAWIKVKPRHTLDLVILAAEWGHGRRKGWLSNLHLGARDPSGGWVMLGKTFKGLTDEMLRWQTERLLSLAAGPTDGWVVEVRPELVVEIAFDGVQRSSRYPGGMALRFARVLRYRPDKSAADADTADAVRAFFP